MSQRSEVKPEAPLRHSGESRNPWCSCGEIKMDPGFRRDDEQNNGELAASSVVKESLTTAADGKRCHTSIVLFGLSGKATVKESLTVRTWGISQATTEESLVVQPERTSHVRLS